MIDNPPCVCIATWKRKGLDERIINALAAEAPRVYVWHNGKHALDVPTGRNVKLFRSPENFGSRCKYLPTFLLSEPDVIIWDDDHMPKKGWYALYEPYVLISRAIGAIISPRGKRVVDGVLPSGEPNMHKPTAPLEHVDYCDTQGMILPRRYIYNEFMWSEDRPWTRGCTNTAVMIWARTRFDADLLVAPQLWDEAMENIAHHDENALAREMGPYRQKRFAELFPADWEYAVDRQKRRPAPVDLLKQGDG